MTMSYREFQIALMEACDKTFEGKTIKIMAADKVDRKDRIAICEDVDAEYKAGSCFDLRQLYINYEAGAGIKQIAEKMKNSISCVSAMDEFTFFSEAKKSWENARTLILPKLINQKDSEEQIEGKPYRQIADIVALYVVARGHEGHYAMITVSDMDMKHWGVTEQDLFEAAKENVQKLEWTCMTEEERIDWIIEGASRIGFDKEVIEELAHDMPHIVPACVEGYPYGAAILFHDEAMRNIANKFGGSFWIDASFTDGIFIISKRLPLPAVRAASRDKRGAFENEKFLSYEVLHYSIKDGLEEAVRFDEVR